MAYGVIPSIKDKNFNYSDNPYIEFKLYNYVDNKLIDSPNYDLKPCNDSEIRKIVELPALNVTDLYPNSLCVKNKEYINLNQNFYRDKFEVPFFTILEC